MTWHFKITGDGVMDVWDHTDTKVATDIPIGYDADGNPISVYSGDYPTEVLEVMNEAAVAEFQANGVSIYALQCLQHGAFELIEEGTP